MIKKTKRGEKRYDLKGDHRKPFELWAVREEKHWRCPGLRAGKAHPLEAAAAARLPGLLTVTLASTRSVTLDHFSSVDNQNYFLGHIKGSWDLINESH